MLPGFGRSKSPLLMGGGALLLACSVFAFTYVPTLPDAYRVLGFDPSFPGNSVVVHMSDAHLVLGTEVVTTNLDPRLVSVLNGMTPPPAKVIVSGDIGTTYSQVPGFDAQGDWNVTYGSNEMCLWFSAIQALTNIAPTNLVWVPGNHDQSWTETNAEMFCRIFTNMPVHQRFDLGGVRFLLMNGGNYADPSPSEREWCRAQLAATSPTQTVAVVVHQPPFPSAVGLPVALREWFRNWQARWWILCGHAHYHDVQVFNIGASNVAQMVTGAASTNTFNGDTDNPGCRIYCLSNGVVGTIYYRMQSGIFQVENEPVWSWPSRYFAAFEATSGLLWRRLMTQKQPGPELLVTNAQNSVEWFAYPEELQWALPLARHRNQATHFVLISSVLAPQVTLDFSADRTNWIRVPLPPNTNWTYSIPLPPVVAQSPTGYARLLGPNNIDDFVFGWGLTTTNGQPQVTFPQLTPVPHQTVALGETLTITNVAIDPYSPPDELHFTLLSAPAGATLDSRTGVFVWQPTNAASLDDAPVMVKVADTGTPEMSATCTFRVSVVRALQPPLTRLAWEDGAPRLSVSGDVGLAYTVEASTNLTDWRALYTTNVLVMPFQVEDAEAGRLPQRFYRVEVGQRTWDPDALAFFERAGLTDHVLYAQEREAIQQLVLDYKATGLWKAKDAIYPFTGFSSNACAQNLRSTNYTVTFTATGITYSNGITGDGNGWGDTGLKFSNAPQFQQDSASLFAYVGTQSPSFNEGLGCFLGAADFNGATTRVALERNGSAFSVGGLNAPDLWNRLEAFGDFRGPVFVSRANSTLQYNGTTSLIVSNNSVISTRLPNATCGLLARKWDVQAADHKTACCLLGVSIGAGMSPPDFILESAIWEKFNTTLGRKEQ